MAFSTISLHLARTSDNRFARITTGDHSAAIWVVILLSIIYAVLVLAVRLGFTKWRAHTLDDIVVAIAYVRNEMVLLLSSCIILNCLNRDVAFGFWHVGIAIYVAEKRAGEIIRSP
jgi:hypothetical protein